MGRLRKLPRNVPGDQFTDRGGGKVVKIGHDDRRQNPQVLRQPWARGRGRGQAHRRRIDPALRAGMGLGDQRRNQLVTSPEGEKRAVIEDYCRGGRAHALRAGG